VSKRDHENVHAEGNLLPVDRRPRHPRAERPATSTSSRCATSTTTRTGSDYRISIAQSIVRGDQIFGRISRRLERHADRISWLPILVKSEGSEYASELVLHQRTAGRSQPLHVQPRPALRQERRGQRRRRAAGRRRRVAFSPRALPPLTTVRADGPPRLHRPSYGGQLTVGRLAEGVGTTADPPAAGPQPPRAPGIPGPSINNTVTAPTARWFQRGRPQGDLRLVSCANGGTNLRPFARRRRCPGVREHPRTRTG